tara:strand:+ start:209 stop:526 length:318 start_codon:yes stop_codon:yes gene_type:complete
MVDINIDARLEAISEIANLVNADFKLRDGKIIEWSKGNKPTEEEIQSKINFNQYQRDRELAFPSWKEQLDMQYWDKVNGTNKWQEAVAKVKADNPKPKESEESSE